MKTKNLKSFIAAQSADNVARGHSPLRKFRFRVPAGYIASVYAENAASAQVEIALAHNCQPHELRGV
jgi:hypothetical protein